ncbi:MAG: hypothetical protein ACKVTZ_00440 [Bacteroidia bacterium]
MPNNSNSGQPYTCLPLEPFIKLGDGEAPKLNYNLPSTTAFDVKSVIPLNVPIEKFKASRPREGRSYSLWDKIRSLSEDEILKEVFALYHGLRGKHGLFLNWHLLKGATIPYYQVETPSSVPSNLFLHNVGDLRSSQPKIENYPVSYRMNKDYKGDVQLGADDRPVEYKSPPRVIKDGSIRCYTSNGTLLSPKFGNPYQIAHYIKEGYVPALFKNFAGAVDIEYLREPAKLRPKLYLVEHLKVATYAKDYGAAKTVNTFSLLPGEKTTITMRSYAKKETTKAKAENILDSFSQNSASSLEHALQSESSTRVGDENSSNSSNNTSSNSSNTFGNTWGHSDTHSSTSNYSFGGGINIGFPEIGLGLEVNGEGGGTSGNSNTTQWAGTSSSTSGSASEASHILTMNSIREQLNGTLQNAIDKTVAESSANRQVDINTTTTESYEEEQESSTVRELANINYSRVLNFVFRQMTQQYLSITYLHDVSFVYIDGYPDSRIEVKLDGLEQMLRDVLIEATDATKVLNDILMDLCSVRDYNQTPQQFIECYDQNLSLCCGTAEAADHIQHVIHKNPACVTEVEGIRIKGVVLDVRERILPVDHIIVDALLGQGEALDCYNMRLQNASADEAELSNERTRYENEIMRLEALNKQQEITLAQAMMDLENQKLTQAMAILDAITDPVQKAEFYKKVFGACCDKPQTQIIP